MVNLVRYGKPFVPMIGKGLTVNSKIAHRMTVELDHVCFPSSRTEKIKKIFENDLNQKLIKLDYRKLMFRLTLEHALVNA